jgi:hypothetical protein
MCVHSLQVHVYVLPPDREKQQRLTVLRLRMLPWECNACACMHAWRYALLYQQQAFSAWCECGVDMFRCSTLPC